MYGEAYLRKLIQSRLSEIDERPKGVGDVLPSIVLSEVRGAADALVAAGSLDQQAAESLYGECVSALAHAGWIEELRVAGIPARSLKAARRRRMALSARRAVQSKEDHTDPLRVVPVLHESGGLPEHRFILLSLELWSNSFRARYAISIQQHGAQEPPAPVMHLVWEVEDDLGTRYRQLGGSGGGGPDWIVMEALFRPSIPSDANSLTLRAHTSEGLDAGRFSVRL